MKVKEKKILFHGNRRDLEKHVKDCKVKKCVVCQMAKETFQRWNEEKKEVEDDA